MTLLLAGDGTIRRLNRTFLGRDRTTDVLSFPFQGDLEPRRRHLGDIAISVPRATRQARRAGWPLGSEMALLLTHGFLHLLGHDHVTDGGTMHRLERRLLQRTAGIDLSSRRLTWDAPAGTSERGRRRPRRASPGAGR